MRFLKGSSVLMLSSNTPKARTTPGCCRLSGLGTGHRGPCEGQWLRQEGGEAATLPVRVAC